MCAVAQDARTRGTVAQFRWGGIVMNPIKSTLGDQSVEVYAWGAAPYIKEALRLDADVWIYVKSGATERTLVHHAGLRPLTKLPWPLSKTQPHNVQLTIEPDREFEQTMNRFYGKAPMDIKKAIKKIYQWGKIDECIGHFLLRVAPNSVVTIRVT